jgi:hypothetical protein
LTSIENDRNEAELYSKYKNYYGYVSTSKEDLELSHRLSYPSFQPDLFDLYFNALQLPFEGEGSVIGYRFVELQSFSKEQTEPGSLLFILYQQVSAAVVMLSTLNPCVLQGIIGLHVIHW